VCLLPYIEQDNIYKQWDLVLPINNKATGNTSRTAIVVKNLICPSDYLPQNPVQYRTTTDWYGATSYGGNGGSRSYYPSSSTADGMFFTTGPDSAPAKNQQPVRINAVTDGTSNTLMLGERNHRDPNFDSFSPAGGSPVNYTDPLTGWCWWAPVGGFAGVGDVTMSAYVPINYRHPFHYNDRASANPPVTNSTSTFFYWQDRRLCAWGSNHTGGANFAFVDGSVRFISETIPLVTLQAISTRTGGEVVSDY
jgi:prepilin-type processing-associated H-X9-DG protein